MEKARKPMACPFFPRWMAVIEEATVKLLTSRTTVLSEPMIRLSSLPPLANSSGYS